MLSKRALAALLSVPRVEGSPYVFTAGADRAMRGLSRPPGAKEPTRPDGRVYGQRHLFQRFVEAVKRAGLQGAPGENIGFHVLRHSFIARARRLRIPDRTTMAATGHLSLAAFARYGSRVDDAEMRAAFDLLEGGKTVQP
jgi:integrase